MIETVENAILKALEENFSDYEVDSFPLDFENYQITSPKGAILARFEDENFKEATINANNSKNKIAFTVFCAQRYLYKHNEAYPLLEKVRSVLNGLDILNQRLYVSRKQFEDVIKGDVWHSYSVYVTLPASDNYPDKSEASKKIIERI